MTQQTLRLAIAMLLASTAFAAAPVEKLRNDQVLVMQQALAAGEALAATPTRPRVLVCLDNGSIEMTDSAGKTQSQAVKRGDTIFQAPQTVKNSGTADLRIAWVEFPGNGGSISWGTSGLAPSYKFLFENPFCRAYDVKIAAGHQEPLHTHQARVVLCLSGAELEHAFPDGRRENSSLKTGEIVFRPGTTHVGNNIGKTDLWVICIEPK